MIVEFGEFQPGSLGQDDVTAIKFNCNFHLQNEHNGSKKEIGCQFSLSLKLEGRSSGHTQPTNRPKALM